MGNPENPKHALERLRASVRRLKTPVDVLRAVIGKPTEAREPAAAKAPSDRFALPCCPEHNQGRT